MKVKDLLWKLLLNAIHNIEQEGKKALCEILTEWEAKAHETPNPTDDLLIGAMITALNCKIQNEDTP